MRDGLLAARAGLMRPHLSRFARAGCVHLLDVPTAALALADAADAFADGPSTMSAISGDTISLNSLGSDIFTFLAASVLVVPLSRVLNVTPVLGFLALGCAIGPYGLGFFSNSEADLQLGDFGIVFLLFIEASPARTHAPAHLHYAYTHTHTHTHTRARTHARAHTHTRAHAHTYYGVCTRTHAFSARPTGCKSLAYIRTCMHACICLQGLQLSPDRLQKLGGFFKLGLAQFLLTIAVITAANLYLGNPNPKPSPSTSPSASPQSSPSHRHTLTFHTLTFRTLTFHPHSSPSSSPITHHPSPITHHHPPTPPTDSPTNSPRPFHPRVRRAIH